MTAITVQTLLLNDSSGAIRAVPRLITQYELLPEGQVGEIIVLIGYLSVHWMRLNDAEIVWHLLPSCYLHNIHLFCLNTPLNPQYNLNVCVWLCVCVCVCVCVLCLCVSV